MLLSIFDLYFSGGAELLFDNKKKHEIVLPELSSPCKLHYNKKDRKCIIFFSQNINKGVSDCYLNTNSAIF